MSRDFKLKYDELESNATDLTKLPPDFGDNERVRNICFLQTNGRRTFLNYAYLVAGDYIPEADSIILSFTSHMITLTGPRLESLFYELMMHKPRQIICLDKRYNALDEAQKYVVNEITIVNSKE